MTESIFIYIIITNLEQKSKELELQIIKSKTLTNHFLEDFGRKKELDSKDIKNKSKESANHDNIDNVDVHNPRHKMFRKSERNQIRKPKESHKQRTEQLVKKKIKVKKNQKKPPGMSKCFSSEISLKGRCVPSTIDLREYIALLKNKVPLTKAEKIEYGSPLTTTLKFPYPSADLLLEDYLEYMQKFQDQEEKSSLQ